jgi:RimJ/RimL family protein N-acetyltransferase
MCYRISKPLPCHDKGGKECAVTELVPPLLNILGEHIALGPLLHERFLALDLQWANDFAVTVHHGQNPHPVTQDMVAARYERITRSPNELWFFIYERASMRAIGTTFFSEMDRVHRTAEFNISIGATDCWGKGYGTETTRLMLTYAFDVLGFHLIWLRVIGTNERAIRAYHRARFRDAGRLREAHRIGHQAHDLCYMDCLATEYQRAAMIDS